MFLLPAACPSYNISLLTRMAELLEVLRTSLRQKVSALTEDNWMYEQEGAQRPELW